MGGEGRIIDAARPDMSPPNQGPTLARLKAELEALSRQLQEHQSQRLPIKVLPLANRREKAILEEFQQLRGQVAQMQHQLAEHGQQIRQLLELLQPYIRKRSNICTRRDKKKG
jgi:chromosome segregation ATPase